MLLTLHHFVNWRHKRIRAGSKALRQGNDLGILPVHFCLLLSCLCEPSKFLWFLWPTDETLSREEAKCVPSDSPPPLLGCRHGAEDTELSPVVLESMTSPPSLVPGLIQAFLGGRVLPRRSGDSNQSWFLLSPGSWGGESWWTAVPGRAASPPGQGGTVHGLYCRKGELPSVVFVSSAEQEPK